MKGHITKRKGVRGVSYRVRIELPRDADGKRRSRSYTYSTRKEAERELARLLRELDTGQFADPARLTVGEYLKRWLSDAAKPTVSRATYSRYELVLRLHVIPQLGSLPLAKLRPLHLQRLYRGLQDHGMSPAGVHRVHAAVHVALGQAVKWQMLAYNVASAVTLPKVERHEIRALTQDETARLLRAAQLPDAQKRTRMFAPLALATATGMRSGEVLGLRWQDVDLDGGALSVVQALREDGQGLYLTQPKTTKGRRRIALPPFAVQVLRAHRAAQDEERLRVGTEWKGGDFVFAAVGGGPWAPSNFARAFRTVLARTAGEDARGHDMPALKLRFHDLRHTHASQLMRAGVHPKIVQERLGHASIGITMDLYSHVAAGMQEEAADRWNEAMTAALTAVHGPVSQSPVPKRCPNGPQDN
jgi:integrase